MKTTYLLKNNIAMMLMVLTGLMFAACGDDEEENFDPADGPASVTETVWARTLKTYTIYELIALPPEQIDALGYTTDVKEEACIWFRDDTSGFNYTVMKGNIYKSNGQVFRAIDETWFGLYFDYEYSSPKGTMHPIASPDEKFVIKGKKTMTVTPADGSSTNYTYTIVDNPQPPTDK